jgi:hypothetical protein
MNRLLQSSLSTRARFLLARDGKESILGGIHLGRELVLPELYLSLDDKGTLSIEYNSVESQTIFRESGSGSVIESSTVRVLHEILSLLGRYTVLDDLSAV